MALGGRTAPFAWSCRHCCPFMHRSSLSTSESSLHRAPWSTLRQQAADRCSTKWPCPRTQHPCQLWWAERHVSGPEKVNVGYRSSSAHVHKCYSSKWQLRHILYGVHTCVGPPETRAGELSLLCSGACHPGCWKVGFGGMTL